MTVADYATTLYTSSANIMYVMLPVVFLGKVVYSNFFGSSEDHLENLKTLVIYFLLIKGFQEVLPYLIDLPHLINGYYDAHTKTNADQIVNAYAKSEQSSSLSFDILSFLDFVTEILEWLVSMLVDVLFLLLALMAPIVILLSVMLNLGIGVKLIFGLFFILSTWNVALAACDVLLKEMAQNKTVEMNMFIVGLSTVILKIIAGATNILMILKSQAASGVMKSLKMGMGALSGGASNFSATGSKGSTAYAGNSYSGASSLDAKLERMPPPQTAGTFAGVARAENRIRQNEIARQDMMKARENLGLNSKQNSSQKAQNSSGSQKSSSSISSSSSSSGSYSSDSKSSSSGSSKMESSVTSNQNSQNQSSNSETGTEPKIRPETMSGSEAQQWAKNTSNFSDMNNDELKKTMFTFDNNAKEQSKLGDAQRAAYEHPKGDYGDTPTMSGHQAASDYSRARDNIGYELQRRNNNKNNNTSSTDADEPIQSGHIDRKKGRK